MTSRTFWTAVFRKGKQVLQQVGKGKAQKVSAKVGRTQLQQQVQAVHSAKGLVQNVSGRLHLYWQESIRNIYFRTLASQLGRQAFRRGGRNVSLLAFAGLVFSQKDEDMERIHTFLSAPIYNKEASLENPVFSMRHLEFGCRLGQGCNAVVYDARLKADQNSEEAKDFESHKDSSAFTDVPEEEKTRNKAMELTGVELENEKIPYKLQHTSSSTNISENFDEEVNSDTFSQADSELSILDLTDDEAQQGDRAPIVFETFNASANIINFTEGDAYTADNVSETDSEISILDESDDGLDEEDRAPLLFPVQPVNLISLDWEMAENSDSDYSLISDNANSYFFKILGDELKKSEDNLTFSDNNAILEMSFAENTLFSSTAAGTSSIAVSSPSTSSESVLSDTNNAEESAVTFDTYKKFPMLEMSVDQVVKWQNLSIENNLQYLSLDSSFSTESSGHTYEKGRYELAVKMMFNYDFESNCDKILRGMCKEAVPALLTGTSEQLQMFYTRHNVRLKHLPAHPNIVEMLGLFVDQIPDLPDGLMNYPAALPERINPHGIGRNMTLFLVMKKYSMTLSEYLSVVHLSVKERLYLLLQLLEAVDHLVRHGIAHRDIKADNVLLDTSKDGPPQVVLADFGCCLADPHHGLWLPFPTDEVDRGGNSALMAPEIASAIAGPFVTLDYSKADLWGIGALAYEILGAENPFYTSNKGSKLDSRSYKMEDLPPLPDGTPQVVQQLVNALLERDLRKRPSPRLAADILQFYMWAPCHWSLPGFVVTRSEITWWLITMATEVNLGSVNGVNRCQTQNMMKHCFVEKFNMNRAKEVLAFAKMAYKN